MKIEGAIPRVQPATPNAPEARWASPPPVVHSPGSEQYGPPDIPPRRPAPLRGTLSSLRYQALQNAPAARTDTSLPGPNYSDSQLAHELGKNFVELSPYLKNGRLTPLTLEKIAALVLTGD